MWIRPARRHAHKRGGGGPRWLFGRLGHVLGVRTGARQTRHRRGPPTHHLPVSPRRPRVEAWHVRHRSSDGRPRQAEVRRHRVRLARLGAERDVRGGRTRGAGGVDPAEPTSCNRAVVVPTYCPAPTRRQASLNVATGRHVLATRRMNARPWGVAVGVLVEGGALGYRTRTSRSSASGAGATTSIANGRPRWSAPSSARSCS